MFRLAFPNTLCPFFDSDVPDCEDDILVTSTEEDVQTTPATGWLASLLELFQQGETTETSTDTPDDDSNYEDSTTGAWDYNIDDDENDSSGSGDDDQDDTGYGPTTRVPKVTTRKPRPRVTRPRIASTPKTVKLEVSENDVLEDFLEALSRLGENRVRVKRAAASAVGQERRRRCKVSKRQHKKFP